MISGAQIRAARALLGLSSQSLAKLAGVGWSTVKRFEEQEDIPAARSGTLKRLEKYLEESGIEFLGDPVDSPGVRLRPKP